MYKVIVAGNIGSGKSTITAHLQQLGALAVSLDRISHAILADDETAQREVLHAFGREILDEDGEIDRSRLARVAFLDEASTEKLNSIMHPLIQERLVDTINQAESACLPSSSPVLVIEVPLLYGHDELIDLADEVLVVNAPRDMRKARLLQHGMDEDDIDNRMARQPADDELEKLATMVFENDGSPEDLRSELDIWWLTRSAGGWTPREDA